MPEIIGALGYFALIALVLTLAAYWDEQGLPSEQQYKAKEREYLHWLADNEQVSPPRPAVRGVKHGRSARVG